MGHEASWIETIEYFKGLKNKTETEKAETMKNFYKYKKEFDECKK